MIVSGNITQNGGVAPYSTAQLLDSSKKALPVGVSANENGYYKIDTSKDSRAMFISFKTAGASKIVDINKIPCQTNSCNLDVELGGGNLEEVVVRPKKDTKIDIDKLNEYDRARFEDIDKEKKKRTNRQILLVSLPIVVLTTVLLYYAYKQRN